VKTDSKLSVPESIHFIEFIPATIGGMVNRAVLTSNKWRLSRYSSAVNDDKEGCISPTMLM
jgi:hypothetical protein